MTLFHIYSQWKVYICLKDDLGVPQWPVGYGSGIVSAVAQFTALVCVRSLAWEHPYAIGMAKKTKPNKQKYDLIYALFSKLNFKLHLDRDCGYVFSFTYASSTFPRPNTCQTDNISHLLKLTLPYHVRLGQTSNHIKSH